jgi:hypothetical protein
VIIDAVVVDLYWNYYYQCVEFEVVDVVVV